MAEEDLFTKATIVMDTRVTKFIADVTSARVNDTLKEAVAGCVEMATAINQLLGWGLKAEEQTELTKTCREKVFEEVEKTLKRRKGE